MAEPETGGADQAPSPRALRPWPVQWMAILITPGLFLQGFDGPLGQASACLLSSVVLLCILAATQPPYAFWRRLGPKLVLPALAFAWLLVVVGVRLSSADAGSGSGLPLAPDLFLPKFLGTLAAFWAFVVGVLCARLPGRLLTHGDWILLVLTLHALIGLAQFGLLAAGISQDWTVIYRDRFAGLIGNSNITACVCGAACVLAWGNMLAAQTDQRNRGMANAPWSMLALAINVIALILTASRLPVLVTLCLMLLQVALQWRNLRASRRLLPALLLAGGSVLLLQSQLAAGLIDRIDLFGGDFGARLDMWQHYARSVPAAMWTGYGPGSFSALNIYTMTAEGSVSRLWTVNSSHNLFLQLLLVGGIPYLLLLSVGAILVAADIFRSTPWRQRNESFAALALAPCVILIAGALDIALDVPASTMVFTALAGLAWGVSSGDSALPPDRMAPATGRASAGR